MTSKSFWQVGPVAEPYTESILDLHRTETCIVGGGISGLTAAYLLAKNNREVSVVHAGSTLSGETTRSSAQLNTVHDDGWQEMIKIHGEESMKLCSRGYREAVDFIHRVCLTEGIECDYEELPAYLFATKDTGGEKWVDSEIEAAKRCGVEDVSKVARVPVQCFESGPSIRYNRQAQFNPQKYLAGLMRVLRDLKVPVFANTEIRDIAQGESICKLTSSTGLKIESSNVLFACNVPFHHRLIPVEALESYRSYVIIAGLKKSHNLENAQYWDNLDPYHFVRLVKSPGNHEYDLLLVGGEDQRVGKVDNELQKYDSLLSWAEKHFPIESRILHRWSAQTIETFDRMPLIGKTLGDTENIQIITGDSGTGLTHGTLGAMITTDNILGRENPYATLFSASRGRLKDPINWIHQNLKSVAEYRDWLSLSKSGAVKPSEGRIIQSGVGKRAIYKDENGKVSEFSAVCPHLGAVMRWNEAEKTFDCPAHGSRFCPKGNRLNGPAACGLSKKN